MILGKQVFDVGSGEPIRVQQGQNITLTEIQREMLRVAEQNGIPMSFATDRVQIGGLIGSLLGNGIEDCLVVSHPQHSHDYCKYVIRVKHEGTYAFVFFQGTGTSKQLKKEAVIENYKQLRRGKTLSYKMGSMAGQLLTSIGRSTQKQEAEKNWYTMVNDAFNSLFT